MGVGDDPAPGRLAEHLGQAHHRDRVGADNIGQHLAWPDRGQLVHVADQQQASAPGMGSCPPAHMCAGATAHRAAFTHCYLRSFSPT